MKRLFFCLSFLFFLTSFLFLAQVSYAQVSYQPNPYLAPNTNPDVPQNQHTLVQSLLLEIMSSSVCFLTGTDPTSPNGRCLGFDTTNGKIGYTQNDKGAIGLAGGMLASLYTPPVSTGEYFRYLAGNFGLSKPAYAETSLGFAKLSPLMRLWSATRNISYMLFVLAFVIIGLAIMLRVKIDPRTVMSIQNQIPKVIIALVFITFSYAIAGLLVDLMYVTNYVLINLVEKTGVIEGTNLTALRKDFNGGNPITVANQFLDIKGMAADAAGTVKDVTQGILTVPDWTKSNGDWWNVFKIINDGARNGLGIVLGAVASFFAFFVFALAILIALFRLWFILLKAYGYILLGTVLAPFWIILGVFPGSTVDFMRWIRFMVAHLAVFPATLGLFLMAKAFTVSFAGDTGNAFFPPFIGNPGDPKSLNAFIGLAFLMLAPTLLDLIRDVLKSKPSPHTAAIGKGLASGQAPVAAAGGFAWGKLTAPGTPHGVPSGWLRRKAFGEETNRPGIIGKVQTGLRKVFGPVFKAEPQPPGKQGNVVY